MIATAWFSIPMAFASLSLGEMIRDGGIDVFQVVSVQVVSHDSFGHTYMVAYRDDRPIDPFNVTMGDPLANMDRSNELTSGQ